MNNDLQDRLGKRMASLLSEQVEPDIATRLAHARRMAVERAAAQRGACQSVGPAQLALTDSFWRRSIVIAVAGAVLAACAWWLSANDVDSSWEAELHYHATAENHIE